jgi:hypothetical protein
MALQPVLDHLLPVPRRLHQVAANVLADLVLRPVVHPLGNDEAQHRNEHDERQRDDPGPDHQRLEVPPPAAVLEQGRHFARVARPFRRVQAEAAVDDLGEQRIDELAMLGRLRGRQHTVAVGFELGLEVIGSLDFLEQVVGLARRLAGQHFIEDCAEGVDVPAAIGAGALQGHLRLSRLALLNGRLRLASLEGSLRLVRRHVEKGAEGRRVVGREVGLAEVGDERVGAVAVVHRVKEDIPRLQVAVVNAAAMHRGQGRGHTREDPHDLRGRGLRGRTTRFQLLLLPLLDPVRQRPAVRLRHHVVRRLRRRSAADLLDAHDPAGPFHRLQELYLREHRLPLQIAGRKEFDGHVFAGLEIVRLPDRAERPGADRTEELVIADVDLFAIVLDPVVEAADDLAGGAGSRADDHRRLKAARVERARHFVHGRRGRIAFRRSKQVGDRDGPEDVRGTGGLRFGSRIGIPYDGHVGSGRWPIRVGGARHGQLGASQRESTLSGYFTAAWGHHQFAGRPRETNSGGKLP